MEEICLKKIKARVKDDAMIFIRERVGLISRAASKERVWLIIFDVC